MEILNVIKRNDTVVGVRINDEGTEYTANLKSLHEKKIFDELLKSGWILKRLPYFFEKQGLHISDLPTLDYNDLSQIDKEDLEFPPSDTYSIDELTSFLPEDDSIYKSWREPMDIRVRNREELYDFLKEVEGKPFNIEDTTTYYPLNYFCSKEALFQPEEYAHPDNSVWTRIIEERRNVTFEAYEQLVSFFQQLGLRDDYAYLDFLEYYFSWGICGMNFKITEQSRDTMNYRLGLTQRSSSHGLKQARIVAMDKNANTLHPLKSTETLEFNCDLSNLEDGEYFPAKAIADDVEEIITYRGKEGVIKVGYNYAVYVFTESGRNRTCPSVRVKSIQGNDYLDCYDANINDPEFYTRVRNEVLIASLLEKYIKKTKIETNASTYKALKAQGMSEACALKYYLANAPQAGSSSKEDLPYSAYIDKVKALMKRDINSEEVNAGAEAELEDIYYDFKNGDLNLDATATGYSNDNTLADNVFKNLLYIAVNELGADPRVINSQLNELDADNTSHLKIVGKNGNFVKLPVIKRDNKARGFNQDISNYTLKAASTARFWMHVNRVYTIPSYCGKFYHVAVEYLEFHHMLRGNNDRIKFPAIENYFKEEMQYDISNLTDKAKINSAKLLLDISIAKCIFKAYLSKDGIITSPITNRAIQVPESVLSAIRHPKCVVPRFESTYGISDMMVDEKGDFTFFCENAYIYPEVVIPKKGVQIEELPFLPCWRDFSETPTYDKFVQAGYLPSTNNYSKFKGWKCAYVDRCRIDHSKYDRMGSNGIPMPNSGFYYSPHSLYKLESAINEYEKARATEKNKQMCYPPSLYQMDQPRAVDEREDYDCTPEEYVRKWKLSDPRKIDRETISSEFPEVHQLGQLDYNVEAVKDIVRKIKILDPLTILNLDKDLFTFKKSLGEKIRLVTIVQGVALFQDGKAVSVYDLDQLDPEVYSIYYNGSSYILLTRVNEMMEVLA